MLGTCKEVYKLCKPIRGSCYSHTCDCKYCCDGANKLIGLGEHMYKSLPCICQNCKDGGKNPGFLVNTFVAVNILRVKTVRMVQTREISVNTCVTVTSASVRAVRIVQTTQNVLVNTLVDVESPNHPGYVKRPTNFLDVLD